MTSAKTTSTSPLLDLLFENAGAGLCLVAPDGTIVRANAEWLRATGFTHDVIGEVFVQLFPGARDMALAMHARARSGHHVELPRHGLVVNGRETWWEGSIDPVAMEGGTGLLITAREVGGAAGRAHLERHARELEATLDCIADGVILYGSRGEIVRMNRAAEEILGFRHSEYLRSGPLAARVAALQVMTSAGEPYRPEDVPTARALRGETVRGEIMLVHRAGREPRWMSASAAPILDATGVTLGAISTFTDVTDRRRHDDALRESESRLRLALDAAKFGTFDLDVATGRLVWDDVKMRMWGITRREEFRYPAVLEGIHPEDRARVAAAIEAAYRTGEYEAEYRVTWPDGSVHWLYARARVEFDEARPARMIGVELDITGRKRAEEALRDSQQRYATMFDRSPLAVSWSEIDTGRITDVNSAWVTLTGIAREEAIGRTSVELGLITAEDRRRWAGEAARRGPVELELSLPTRANGARTVLLRAERVVLAGTGFLVSAIQDITDRKRAEEALRATEERWNAAIENFSEGAIIATEDEQVIYWNPAARAMHGFTSAREGIEPLAKTPETFELWTPGGEHLLDLDEWPMRRIKRGEAVHRLELRLRRPDQGWERFVSYSGAMVRTSSGERLIFLSVTDLTEQRRAERALREADQRKDEFLATLSHELRNPLAPIRNASYILGHADAAGDAARRAREIIERQTEHITRLVDDLLDVTRIARGKIELRRSSVDLREVVVRAAEDFRLVMDDRGIVFETVLPEGRVAAEVDAVRVTQIVGNLLHNASKFTKRGETVTLSLAVDAGEAVIAVRDTGAGIEPPLLATVFEPFVQGDRTLARTEGGLGLGLALVKGIAEMHGGAVSVSSAGTGRGSEFVVRLPLRGARPRHVAGAPGAPKPSATAAKRVLVVDDNHDAADTLADLVRMLGHEAEVAYDGPGALRAAREQLPDVVLCDIGLPGMNGYEVARELRRLSPDDLRVIAVSGYAQPEDVARAIDAGFDGHVAKPPDPGKLEELLGE